MSEPTYVDLIARASGLTHAEALAEVKRLRDELARRDEQIAALWALHQEEVEGPWSSGYCRDCEQSYPCNTATALDGTP